MRIIKKGNLYYPQVNEGGGYKQLFKRRKSFDTYFNFFNKYGYKTEAQALKVLREYEHESTMTVIVEFKNLKEIETYMKERGYD